MELLTKNKAYKKLKSIGIGRVRLERLLASGQIECICDGGSYLIPDWSLEQWLKNTTKHPLNLSLEAKPTTSKYQPSSMDNEYSFVKLRTQRIKDKLKSMQI